MSHSRQNHSLGSTIASKFVCNDDAGPASAGLQELAKEPHSGKTVALGLHQNVYDRPVLIDSTPEIMLDSVDLQEHLIQKPFVPQFWPSPFQFGGIGSPERIASAADCLVAQLDSPVRHHQFHFAQTDGKVEVQPHTLRDDLFREPITAIRVGWHFIRITSARCDSARKRLFSVST